MSKAATPAQASELRHWRLLDQFRRRLARHYDAAAAAQKQPRRRFFADDYFCLLLFGLLNPTLKSMRALCQASASFAKMRQVCSRPVALASFSEGQHAFDPELLAGMLRALAREARGRVAFGERRVREAIQCLTVVDGTVWRAVRRMAWCDVGWNGSALKLHRHFSVLDQTPQDWTITPDKVCERKTMKGQLAAGAFYVADRLYGHDYAFLSALSARPAGFVIRISGTAVRVSASPDKPLSAEDRAAGVVRDRLEELGARSHYPAVRVVEIRSASQTFLLAPNRHDLPAELIGLIYRYQIELFFKWLKTIFGLRSLAGRIASRRGHSTLLRLDRLGVAPAGNRPTAHQATDGGAASLLLRFCDRRRTVPDTAFSKKLIRPRRVFPNGETPRPCRLSHPQRPRARTIDPTQALRPSFAKHCPRSFLAEHNCEFHEFSPIQMSVRRRRRGGPDRAGGARADEGGDARRAGLAIP